MRQRDKSTLTPFTKKRLEPFDQTWLERFATLRRRCVIRDDIYYQETLDLTIWRGGAVLGMLRHPDIAAMSAVPDFEIAEQYFIWMRRGDRYVGERLEIRLWGPYLPRFLTEGGDALREIQETPQKLLASREVLPGRETGYVALYQMQRPPTRVDFGLRTISVIYECENEVARAALSQQEI